MLIKLLSFIKDCRDNITLATSVHPQPLDASNMIFLTFSFRWHLVITFRYDILI